ncbi:MAG: acetate kinase [bacterium]
MKILVFNCGSSSIKYQFYDMPSGKVIAKGLVQRIGEKMADANQKTESGKEIKIQMPIADHEEAIAEIVKMLTDKDNGAIKSMAEVEACGHRVVHGGDAVSGSVLIDAKLEKIIEDFSDLAPLHNPPNLIGIKASKKVLGDKVPQVACFDTAFHASIPEKAYLYALPYEMYEKFKIRRYGFHGTSHRYVARKAAEMLGIDKYKLNAITAHLGNGCSMAAVKDGKSVDTSMGLTPLEGLVMGTRTGDFDPAIIFYLLKKGYEAKDIDGICNKKSGLIGISGLSNDVRDLEEKAKAGEKRAKLALDIFAYRIKKYVGSYLAVLNGCDCVIVTGGIGENGVTMRKRAFENLEALGIKIDDAKNAVMVGGKGGEITTADSKVKVLVVPTNEEGAIAGDTYALISGGSAN